MIQVGLENDSGHQMVRNFSVVKPQSIQMLPETLGEDESHFEFSNVLV